MVTLMTWHNLTSSMLVILICKVPLWAVLMSLVYLCKRKLTKVVRPTREWGPGDPQVERFGSTFRSHYSTSDPLNILHISIFTENIRLFVPRCGEQFMRSSTTLPQGENTTTAQITTLATTIRYITNNDSCSLRENSLSV